MICLQRGKRRSASNLAVTGVGNITGLIADLKKDTQSSCAERAIEGRRRSAVLVSAAIMLYILCVALFLFMDGPGAVLLMFVMIATATGLIVLPWNDQGEILESR